MPKSLVARVTTLIALLLIAAIAIFWAFREAGPPGEGGYGTPLVGGSFTLTDQSGKSRSDGEFRGKLMLVYFGYTYCPDVCPTELQTMSDALDKLGAAGEAVQPIFITVDPDRDTAEQLKNYAENFHPRLLALTGSAAQIAEAARAYKVFYQPVKQADGDYLMDHTSIVYLIGSDGRYIAHFSDSVTAEQMAAEIAKHL